MISPSISVAMSVYNGERFLGEAIESILAQTFSDFEFLILDDGSNDGSRAIIESFAARDARIRPIFCENRGLIASLNQLVEEARAPLIARMDADDISIPERFARQVAFLSAHPDYGVVGTWNAHIDEDGVPCHVGGPDHAVDHQGFLAAIEAGEPPLCHPSVMFRRDVVRSVGGYHAAFRHTEDLDLWLRLASVTKLASIPERLLRYRHNGGQVSRRHAMEQQIGAAVAFIAYRERAAGHIDPTATLDCLPPVDQLDSLFGREGITREVRRRVVPSLVYSREAMLGEGFAMLLQFLDEGGSKAGMWRSVLRLMRFKAPWRAFRLFAKLLTTRTQGTWPAEPLNPYGAVRLACNPNR